MTAATWCDPDVCLWLRSLGMPQTGVWWWLDDGDSGRPVYSARGLPSTDRNAARAVPPLEVLGWLHEVGHIGWYEVDPDDARAWKARYLREDLPDWSDDTPADLLRAIMVTATEGAA
jgi:hypothetical protein